MKQNDIKFSIFTASNNIHLQQVHAGRQQRGPVRQADLGRPVGLLRAEQRLHELRAGPPLRQRQVLAVVGRALRRQERLRRRIRREAELPGDAGSQNPSRRRKIRQRRTD